jgi:hypothetical protein
MTFLLRFSAMCALCAAFISGLLPSTAHAEVTCVGEGPSKICTDITYDADGNMSIRTFDGLGNDFSSTAKVKVEKDGSAFVETTNSNGENVSVRSSVEADGTVVIRKSNGEVCRINDAGYNCTAE